MTVININIRASNDGGTVPLAGVLLWEPSTARVGADGALLLPRPFPVTLDATGAATVDVEPTVDGVWAWTVTELVTGQPSRRKTLTVPATGPVEYTDLLTADPATLDPAFNVTPDPDNPGYYLIGA